MKLQRIKLKNFKGFTADYVIPEKGLCVKGRNGVGKTTIIDAVTWCLFGKFSDRTVVSPKPLDANNNPVTCDVSVTLHTGNGVFRREYKEIWKKKRGEADREFSGHESAYYVNEVPVLARDYQAFVETMFTEEQFFITAVPTYFGRSFSWQERRKVLASLVETPTNEALILKYPDLKDILNDNFTEKDYVDSMTVTKAAVKKLNETRKGIPDRLDEVERLIVKDLPSLPELEAELKRFASEKEEMKSGNADTMKEAVNAINAEIRALRAKKVTVINAYDEAKGKEEDGLHQEAMAGRNSLRAEREQIESRMNDIFMEKQKYTNNSSLLKRQIAGNEDNISQMEAKLKKTEGNLERLNQSTPTFDTKCYACNRDYPAEQLENSRKEAAKTIADSIEKCESIIAGIKEEIKFTQQSITADRTELEATQKLVEQKGGEADALKKDAEEINGKADEINKQLDAKKLKLIEKYMDKVRDSKEIKSIDENIAKLQDRMLDLAEPETDASLVDAQITIAQEQMQTHENNRQHSKRKADLKAKARDMAAQTEEGLRIINLLELRLRAVAEILETSLNSLFSIAAFKLFHLLVNGELKETCEVLYRGKETMSTGEEIYVGADIAEVLADKWNVSPPLMVDGMQNLTYGLPTKRQRILTITTDDESMEVTEL